MTCVRPRPASQPSFLRSFVRSFFFVCCPNSARPRRHAAMRRFSRLSVTVSGVHRLTQMLTRSSVRQSVCCAVNSLCHVSLTWWFYHSLCVAVTGVVRMSRGRVISQGGVGGAAREFAGDGGEVQARRGEASELERTNERTNEQSQTNEGKDVVVVVRCRSFVVVRSLSSSSSSLRSLVRCLSAFVCSVRQRANHASSMTGCVEEFAGARTS